MSVMYTNNIQGHKIVSTYKIKENSPYYVFKND